MSLTPTDDNTHIIVVKNNPKYPNPIFHKNIGDAIKEGNAIIGKEETRCEIYQIRTILQGKNIIEREDFNDHATK